MAGNFRTIDKAIDAEQEEGSRRRGNACDQTSRCCDRTDSNQLGRREDQEYAAGNHAHCIKREPGGIGRELVADQELVRRLPELIAELVADRLRRRQLRLGILNLCPALDLHRFPEPALQRAEEAARPCRSGSRHGNVLHQHVQPQARARPGKWPVAQHR